jgi:hypothetical protein
VLQSWTRQLSFRPWLGSVQCGLGHGWRLELTSAWAQPALSSVAHRDVIERERESSGAAHRGWSWVAGLRDLADSLNDGWQEEML